MRLYDDRPGGTVARARELRRDAPEPERRLLRALRTAYPHLKWRHQTPVGPFYVDILCISERLVIEVDGDDHAFRSEQDAARTTFLAGQGFRVIRYANADVTRNLDGVVTDVGLTLKEKGGTA